LEYIKGEKKLEINKKKKKKLFHSLGSSSFMI
jgi:hypothetical protein